MVVIVKVIGMVVIEYFFIFLITLFILAKC